MGNGVVKGTKTLGPVWAGSERSGGERSEPPRSGEPAQTAARQAGRVSCNPEVSERPVRRRFTAEYKERIVREAEGCTQSGQIGALLRREGLYSSDREWIRSMTQRFARCRGLRFFASTSSPRWRTCGM